MGIKLNHAPVFYALAHIQFTQVSQLLQFFPAVQQGLASAGFAEVIMGEQALISFKQTPDAPPEVSNTRIPRFSFLAAGRTEGFIFLHDALVYHTTRYDTWETFAERLSLGMALVQSTIQPGQLRRVGLRYLNAVVPAEGETLDTYLVKEVLGMQSQLDGKLQHAMSETIMQTSLGNLVCRVFSGDVVDSPPFLPAELMPLELELDEQFRALNGRIAVVDIDHYSLFEEREFDLAYSSKVLNDLKSSIETTFRRASTPEGMAIWESKT
jgi:uncharacterized protein (TIGR04255 family)